MPKRKTHEEFVTDLREVSASISVIGEYTNCRTKILVRCDTCGYQWLAGPSDLLGGHGCPRCSKKERKTTSRFCKEVAVVNPSIEVMDEYINTSTKIKVRCTACGYSWMANPSTLLCGNGCPSCAGTKKKSQDEFVRKLNIVNPDVELLGEYKNNRTKVLVRCSRCGYKWSVTPHNLLDARSRCPQCTHSSTSFMEQFIVGWLSQALGTDAVIHRDTTAIGAELDVYVPSLKLAFEPGAWHWHKDKLKEDCLKRSRCTEKGIRLITIYDKVPEEEQFAAKDVFLYTYDIRIHKGSDQLARLLSTVIHEQGVSVSDLDVNLDDIVNLAYKNSVKSDTDKYIEKLAANGIDVKVLGVYKSSASRIQVQCKVCGHIWAPRADTLLQGNSNCKKCGIIKNGKAHLKSHEKFLTEAEERNPTVEILGHYTKAADKIHVRCRLCGLEWYPVANSLVKKNPSSCPECGKMKMLRTRRQKLFK